MERRRLGLMIPALLMVSPIFSFGQNPIVPPGVYIADPSARVWPDGKIYIYGSRDESPDYYCSRSYHVLSSSDMIRWALHENAFSSAGDNDQVPYSDAPLYAPDCQYHGGLYFLYYCQPIGGQTAGTAVSRSPFGPFTDGRPIDLGDKAQIDPNVFIDDDGQAYYVWGQFSLKIARLNPNMREIDKASMIDGLLTEQEHFFHEGANMRKRGDLYYLVYSHMGRADTPTCIGYAVGHSPLGPFEYRGVIIDNRGCDPMTWNNHGSIEEFNGRWYVFYHRSTHGSSTMRKACVEPIDFDEDGNIAEVEMTSQGAGPPLDAFVTIDAARACLLRGRVRIRAYAADVEELGEIRNRDRAAYKYIDFGNGSDKIVVKVAPGKSGGKIDIVLDRPWMPAAGSLVVPPAGESGGWVTLEADLQNVAGVRAVWFRFSGKGDDLFRVDSFRFMKK